MSEHPNVDVMESFVMGTMAREHEDGFASHVSTCEDCKAKLVREARVEHALFELGAFREREASKRSRRYRALLTWVLPAAAVVAAASVLLFVRRSSESGGGDASRVTAPAFATADPPTADAQAVLATLRPELRRCYEDGLAQDPTMSGKVVLGVSVLPDGAVGSVSVEKNEGLSSKVASCLVDVVHGARFVGNGTNTTLQVPIAFKPKKR